jgi:hypothetical protein
VQGRSAVRVAVRCLCCECVGGRGQGLRCGTWSDEWHACLFVCVCVCVLLISLRSNNVGAEGASAIGTGLLGVSMLMSLKCVMQSRLDVYGGVV